MDTHMNESSGLITTDPLLPVKTAWRCGWNAATLAQCYNDMPIEVAQELLDTHSLKEAAMIIGCEVE